MSREYPERWVPLKNPIDVALLAKLGEEMSECSKVVFRCIMQGVHEQDPDNLKSNLENLQKEIADVYAMLFLVRERYKIENTLIDTRIDSKIKHKRAWVDQLKDEPGAEIETH